ncbi:MAG TPA: hypothetical protein VFX07_11750 [Candidatus Udaeobacter sp.]|jgi:hypothetical protein|nr:hypothetical protein [Candidatus Udaeobacter sp.]
MEQTLARLNARQNPQGIPVMWRDLMSVIESSLFMAETGPHLQP